MVSAENAGRLQRKIRIIAGFVCVFPIVIVLPVSMIFAGLISEHGNLESVETMGVLLFALWIYIIKIGFPVFGGYILLIWKQSRFMNKGWKKLAKDIVSFIGITIAIIWLYGSIRII